MAKIHGSDIVLASKSGLTYSVIAAATECELSMERELVEVCSRNTGAYREFRPGRRGWSIKGNFVTSGDTVFADLLALVANNTPVKFRMYVTGTTNGLQGEGYVTGIDVSAPRGEMATYSMTIQGTGSLSSTLS